MQRPLEEKSYKLVEYIKGVKRECVEVLMELNINGIMDTTYSYGMIWQSCRYNTESDNPNQIIN